MEKIQILTFRTGEIGWSEQPPLSAGGNPNVTPKTFTHTTTNVLPLGPTYFKARMFYTKITMTAMGVTSQNKQLDTTPVSGVLVTVN